VLRTGMCCKVYEEPSGRWKTHSRSNLEEHSRMTEPHSHIPPRFQPPPGIPAGVRREARRVSGQLLRGRGSADRLRALRLLRTYHLPGGICDATPARVTMASVIIMVVVVVVVVADERADGAPQCGANRPPTTSITTGHQLQSPHRCEFWRRRPICPWLAGARGPPCAAAGPPPCGPRQLLPAPLKPRWCVCRWRRTDGLEKCRQARQNNS
jgi:hypothetical protein